MLTSKMRFGVVCSKLISFLNIISSVHIEKIKISRCLVAVLKEY